MANGIEVQIVSADIEPCPCDDERCTKVQVRMKADPERVAGNVDFVFRLDHMDRRVFYRDIEAAVIERRSRCRALSEEREGA